MHGISKSKTRRLSATETIWIAHEILQVAAHVKEKGYCMSQFRNSQIAVINSRLLQVKSISLMGRALNLIRQKLHSHFHDETCFSHGVSKKRVLKICEKLSLKKDFLFISEIVNDLFEEIEKNGAGGKTFCPKISLTTRYPDRPQSLPARVGS